MGLIPILPSALPGRGQKVNLTQEAWDSLLPSAFFPARVFNKGLRSEMSGRRKFNIKASLPFQEDRLADHRKNWEGQGEMMRFRAAPECSDCCTLCTGARGW